MKIITTNTRAKYLNVVELLYAEQFKYYGRPCGRLTAYRPGYEGGFGLRAGWNWSQPNYWESNYSQFEEMDQTIASVKAIGCPVKWVTSCGNIIIVTPTRIFFEGRRHALRYNPVLNKILPLMMGEDILNYETSKPKLEFWQTND